MKKYEIISKGNLVSVLLIVVTLLLGILSYRDTNVVLWILTMLSVVLTAISFHYSWKDTKQKEYIAQLSIKFLSIKAANPGWMNGFDIGLGAHPAYLREIARHFTVKEIDDLQKISLIDNDELNILIHLIDVINRSNG